MTTVCLLYATFAGQFIHRRTIETHNLWHSRIGATLLRVRCCAGLAMLDGWAPISSSLQEDQGTDNSAAERYTQANTNSYYEGFVMRGELTI